MAGGGGGEGSAFGGFVDVGLVKFGRVFDRSALCVVVDFLGSQGLGSHRAARFGRPPLQSSSS